jgi:hypothetical protein
MERRNTRSGREREMNMVNGGRVEMVDFAGWTVKDMKRELIDLFCFKKQAKLLKCWNFHYYMTVINLLWLIASSSFSMIFFSYIKVKTRIYNYLFKMSHILLILQLWSWC